MVKFPSFDLRLEKVFNYLISQVLLQLIVKKSKQHLALQNGGDR